ncbi:MAG: ATP-binding protein [Ignavibacteriae bacterium]|nr:ATP-binding protein [Ignavibacteriota bacterium]
MQPNIPVIADKPMIDIILRNLISNAIKFSNINGSIVIKAEENELSVSVSVKDNGVGISPEDINNLFRLDVNHTTPGTQKEKGTGLGLLLCKEFVEKHNGELHVESDVSTGSTFTFDIPKRPDIEVKD